MAQQDSVRDFISSEKLDEYPLCSEQLSAIETALVNHQAPIEPIAAQIAQPILEANKSIADSGLPTNGYDYSRLWRVISAAIHQLTAQNDRLVDLVVALARVPDPTGYMANMQDMREHWLEFNGGFIQPDYDDPKRFQKQQAFINMTTFNAKIAAHNIPGFMMRNRASFVFRSALEDTPWEVHHIREFEEYIEDLEGAPYDDEVIAYRDRVVEDYSVRRLNYWVPAAAAWIKYDGQGIYEAHEKIPEGSTKPTLWQGEGQFSKERFHFWIERFEWISKVSALDYDTRVTAANAAKLMKHIEGQA